MSKLKKTAAMNSSGLEATSVVDALKGAMDATASGKTDVKSELTHIIRAAKYLKANWKTALPAVAAMGASAYLMTLRKKSGLTPKSKASAKKKTAKVLVRAKPAKTGAKKKAARKTT